MRHHIGEACARDPRLMAHASELLAADVRQYGDGFPALVTTKDSPACTALRIRPLSFRSSWWEMVVAAMLVRSTRSTAVPTR